MENGNLSVGMCKFKPVLISISGISLPKYFDNCQHEMGRVCSLMARQFLAGAWASLTLFIKKSARVHEFQGEKKEGEELL